VKRPIRTGAPAKFAAYNFFVLIALGLGATYILDRYIRNAVLLNLSLAVGAVLIVLYLVQFTIVKSASAELTRENRDLRKSTDEVVASYEKLKAHYVGTLIFLDRTIDARDEVSDAHSDRLKSIAHKMAGRLALSPDAHRRIAYGSQLHDIGKIGVPERILQKPGDLDPAEATEMRRHSRLGAEIIRSVPFLADIADVIEHHHERFDGAGYPDNLAGDDIPIESRILSVVDAFDTMTHDRPYRPALSPEIAVDKLVEGRGSQFDPGVVDLFLLYLAEEQGINLPPEESGGALAA